MDLVDFVSKFEDLRTRLSELSLDQKPQEPSDKAALTEELNNLLEELQVAAEMLQQKNGEILLAQQLVINERLRYQRLFELAPNPYLVTDLDGKITEANLASGRMFNTPLSYLIGKPIAVFVALEDRKDFRQNLIRLASTQDPSVDRIQDWEFRFKGRKQEPVDVDITVGYISENRDRESPAALLWILRDITEQKQTHRELKEARATLEARVAERTAQLTDANQRLKTTAAELERKNRDLQDFAFIASHDLQEPLRKIQAFGGLVEAASLPESVQDPIRRMINAASNMQVLLEGLLEYSRVGTRGSSFTEVDLNILVGEIIDDLDYRLLETGGQIEVDSLPRVIGDPMQIRQMIQNLLVNGLKFHRQDIPPLVHVSSRVENEHVELLVEDNGIGFDMRHAERVFQPFQRLHGRSQYSGAGMGLSICRKIAERHGGIISVESAPGQGSTFTITLPQSQSY